MRIKRENGLFDVCKEGERKGNDTIFADTHTMKINELGIEVLPSFRLLCPFLRVATASRRFNLL